MREYECNENEEFNIYKNLQSPVTSVFITLESNDLETNFSFPPTLRRVDSSNDRIVDISHEASVEGTGKLALLKIINNIKDTVIWERTRCANSKNVKITTFCVKKKNGRAIFLENDGVKFSYLIAIRAVLSVYLLVIAK